MTFDEFFRLHSGVATQQCELRGCSTHTKEYMQEVYDTLSTESRSNAPKVYNTLIYIIRGHQKSESSPTERMVRTLFAKECIPDNQKWIPLDDALNKVTQYLIDAPPMVRLTSVLRIIGMPNFSIEDLYEDALSYAFKEIGSYEKNHPPFQAVVARFINFVFEKIAQFDRDLPMQNIKDIVRPDYGLKEQVEIWLKLEKWENKPSRSRFRGKQTKRDDTYIELRNMWEPGKKKVISVINWKSFLC